MNLEIFLMALQGWVDSVKGFKAACLHHKRERKWYFFFMDFHFILPLISLLPWLFSYLEGKKKTLRSIIFASLFKRLVVILPSADQHVQYNVQHSRSLFGFLNRERPFSLASRPNSGLSSPF